MLWQNVGRFLLLALVFLSVVAIGEVVISYFLPRPIRSLVTIGGAAIVTYYANKVLLEKGKSGMIAAGMLVILALAIVSFGSGGGFPSGRNTSEGLVTVVDVQTSVNTAGVPVVSKLLELENCTGSCQEEFRDLREALLPYEVILTDSVERLNNVDVPSEYRRLVTEYNTVLSLRLEGVQLYLRGIDPSGNLIDIRSLEEGDEKWTESQLRMSYVVNEIQKIYKK